MAIAFVPVRGGSKSIPLKNIKLFCGKPLVYWCCLALQNSECIDKIVVATDSEEIRNVVLEFNFAKLVVYDRDSENAADGSSTESVMLEYLSKVNISAEEYFFLVQATSPLLNAIHIEEAFQLLKRKNADSLLTCVRYKRFFWNEDGTPINYNYNARPRRQDFKGELMENGAFYISKAGDIIKHKNRLSGTIAVYEMPEHTAFEIDEPDDWPIMEKLFKTHVLPADEFYKVQQQKIKLFISDVDGVMTDAGMYYTENGDELKKFNTYDGMGFQMLREAGIKTAIITTENTKLVERRGQKLKIDYVYQGKGFGSKLDAAKEICEIENILLSEVAYVGDDINCLDILQAVGVAACPKNATRVIKEIKGIYHLKHRGGDGAVREYVEWLFDNNYILE